MRKIIETLLEEGIDEQMVHRVLDLIEEEYEVIEEDVHSAIDKYAVIHPVVSTSPSGQVFRRGDKHSDKEKKARLHRAAFDNKEKQEKDDIYRESGVHPDDIENNSISDREKWEAYGDAVGRKISKTQTKNSRGDWRHLRKDNYQTPDKKFAEKTGTEPGYGKRSKNIPQEDIRAIKKSVGRFYRKKKNK